MFYQSPVQPLCAAILTLLSLHPGMIESGLKHAACVRPSRPMSPIPNFDDEEDEPSSWSDSNLTTEPKNKEDHCNDETANSIHQFNRDDDTLCLNDNKTLETMEGKCLDSMKNNNETVNFNKQTIELNSAKECTESYNLDETNGETNCRKIGDNLHRVESANTISLAMGEGETVLPRDTSNDALSEARVTSNITQIAHVDPELCGLPLNIYTKVI